MRGITWPAGPPWPAVLLAAVLAAGCSAGRAGPGPTADTCYAFGVRALQRHTTVTTAPRACAGLSRAQTDLAVARAIRDVVGARHRAVARRLAYQEGDYLARLIAAAPPPGPARAPGRPRLRPGSRPGCRSAWPR